MGPGLFSRINQNKGQSTVEYIVLVTAVIAVIIVFLSKGGPFQKTVNQTLTDAKSSMNSMSTKLKNSRP
ncbi:MAG: class III signal peptide-containing protein [Candidatus Omnitrophica bacterium]|nr:class III signal peptide-containing protein [Candidatus Omnitrophota bacterium]